MGKGLNSYDEKRKREVRRRNHIARDLSNPKFSHKVIPAKRLADKRWKKKDWDEFDEEER